MLFQCTGGDGHSKIYVYTPREVVVMSSHKCFTILYNVMRASTLVTIKEITTTVWKTAYLYNYVSPSLFRVNAKTDQAYGNVC
jgi:hypothetical protein